METTRSHRPPTPSWRCRVGLVAALSAIVFTAAAPSAALAQSALPDESCDFPAVRTTTEVTYRCEGTQVEPPAQFGDASPSAATRRCRHAFRTGTIRARGVNCGTARGVARRRSGRSRYRALGFFCRTSRTGLVTCRRAALRGTSGSVVRVAGYVAFRPARSSRR